MSAGYTRETLFTSANGFDIPATPCQRAICRISDGLPLGDLATHPDVLTLVGGKAAIDCLPVGEKPKRVCIFAAVRCGKTVFEACSFVHASQTVDVSGLKPGEMPRYPLLSLTKDHARVALNFIVGTLQARPALRKLLACEPTGEIVTVRHPKGRLIEGAIQPVTEAGGSVVSRWLLGVGADEYPRQPWDGVIRIQDLLTAAQGRILPGGQIFCIGSPWATAGPAYEDFTNGFAKPTADLVVLRGTGPMLNPSWWTPERCERLKKTDPRAYKTDVLGEFIDDVSCPFEAEAVEAAFRSPRERCDATGAPVVLMDASGGKGDSFTACVAQWLQEGIDDSPIVMADIVDDAGNVTHARAYPKLGPDGQFIKNPDWGRGAPCLSLTNMMSFDGRFGTSITAEHIVSRIAALAHRVGAQVVLGDSFGAYQFESMFQRHKLRFVSVPWVNETKARAVTQLKKFFREGTLAIEINEEQRLALKREIGRFQERLLPSGLSAFGARSGGHDDRVALLIGAAIADADGLLRGSPIRKQRSRADFDGSGFQFG